MVLLDARALLSLSLFPCALLSHTHASDDDRVHCHDAGQSAYHWMLHVRSRMRSHRILVARRNFYNHNIILFQYCFSKSKAIDLRSSAFIRGFFFKNPMFFLSLQDFPAPSHISMPPMCIVPAALDRKNYS